MVKLDRNLNLVVPVDLGGGRTAYAHSAPVPYEVYRASYAALGKTYAEIFTEGYGVLAGPKVAARLLEKNGGEAFLGELRRLTTVAVPTAAGWDKLPLETAREALEPEDVDGVENLLAFFTVVSAMMGAEARRLLTEMLVSTSILLTTSSTLTDFLASSTTSTAVAATAPSPGPSAIPS